MTDDGQMYGLSHAPILICGKPKVIEQRQPKLRAGADQCNGPPTIRSLRPAATCCANGVVPAPQRRASAAAGPAPWSRQPIRTIYGELPPMPLAPANRSTFPQAPRRGRSHSPSVISERRRRSWQGCWNLLGAYGIHNFYLLHWQGHHAAHRNVCDLRLRRSVGLSGIMIRPALNRRPRKKARIDRCPPIEASFV
jgi:hypothetical protein